MRMHLKTYEKFIVSELKKEGIMIPNTYPYASEKEKVHFKDFSELKNVTDHILSISMMFWKKCNR